MTFGLLSFLGGRVPLTGSLNVSVPSSAPAGNNFMTVLSTGATETISGDYKIITYYGSGTFNVQSLGIDTVSGSTVELMLVAGGGGGGRDMGGGGGAGGYYACTSFKVFETQYTVTVGSGGAGAVSDGTSTWNSGANRPGSNGTSSIITSPFGTLEAIGGGGGASRHDSQTNFAGSGGSGGGASGQFGNHGRALRGDMGYLGSPSGGQWHPGGGGGAGTRGMHGAETALQAGPGNTNSPYNAPHGGRGVQNSILGPAYWWCGGGGGGGHSSNGGNGGTGGGGGGGQAHWSQNQGVGGASGINAGSNGQQASPVGSTSTGQGYSGGNAGQYTGGGGGGTSHLTGNAANGPSTVSGNGGSGIVVIKYKFQ
jgi:hypothetical protein